MDRENVIKGLEEISDYFFDIYRNDTDSYKREKAQEYSDVAIDALALLKEQEAAYQGAEELLRQKTILFDDAIKRLKEQDAVKPKSKVRHGANAQIQHFCGNCNSMLHGKPKFCSQCGQAVKWK